MDILKTLCAVFAVVIDSIWENLVTDYLRAGSDLPSELRGMGYNDRLKLAHEASSMFHRKYPVPDYSWDFITDAFLKYFDFLREEPDERKRRLDLLEDHIYWIGYFSNK